MIDEARLHLSARRPGGQDDGDPTIAAALARAAGDPTLHAWAEAEQRSDAALALKLRSVQPPPGLRETILAGASVGRRRWWQWFEAPAWRSFRNSELVAAAAIVLLLAVAVAWNNFTGRKPESWQAFATTEVARIENADIPVAKIVDTMSAVQQWLNEQTCPAPSALPAGMRTLRIYGCSKAMWRGEPMSIVCFLTGGHEVHLVIVSVRNLPAPPPERRDHAVFATINGYMTASWAEGDRAMMLLGKVEEKDLRQLLGTTTAAWGPLRFFVKN